ncbi:MAG: ethanolamine utilization protein EutN [Gemmatales bacterium]|nr:MAG: ethanolamine utilization protein EutN [Gemmatales bacterium]
MQLAIVVGHAVSTAKHISLVGWKLMLVQPLTSDGQGDGDPVLAIDRLGAGIGDRVIISNDGAGARELVGARNSPVRWLILGLCEDVG